MIEKNEEFERAVAELEAHYNFGFEPAPSQLEVLEALFGTKYKEVVLVAGRGWGKDLLLGMYLYHQCQKEYTRVAFVCPFYSQVKKFFQQVMRGLNEATGDYFIPQGHPTDPTFTIVGNEIRFKNGSCIVGLSADNPDGMRGTRANVIIMNEIEDIPKNVISTQIYAIIKKATKEDKQPKIVHVGTPKGKRHLFEKFVTGLHNPTEKTKRWYNPAKLQDDCISFHRTYLDNERSSVDVKLNKGQMTPIQFRQEIMAEFLDESEIFSNLEDAFFMVDLGVDSIINYWAVDPVKTKTEGNNVIPGRKYVAGYDIARERDWSVLIIIDCTDGKMAYFERFQKIDYVTQSKKVLDVCKEYNNASLLYDATGVGNAITDILYDQNKNPEQAIGGKVFTNESKADLIGRLVIRIQRDKEWIAQIPVLQSELQSLKSDRTPLGKPTYKAPEGMHDDCVMSLALCNMLYLDETSTGTAVMSIALF